MRKIMNAKQVKHPCMGCVYFNAGGETNRTMPCDGRMTQSEHKAAEKAEQEKKQNHKKNKM